MSVVGDLISDGAKCSGTDARTSVPHSGERFTGALIIKHISKNCTSTLTIDCTADSGEDLMYSLRDELGGVASWIECSCGMDFSGDDETY